jgi:hypothetical protein
MAMPTRRLMMKGRRRIAFNGIGVLTVRFGGLIGRPDRSAKSVRKINLQDQIARSGRKAGGAFGKGQPSNGRSEAPRCRAKTWSGRL